MMSPSSFAVFALKFLQKSMILTPCGPSADPTGGAGVAFPAAIWSFTIACTFFAMIFLPPERGSHTTPSEPPRDHNTQRALPEGDRGASAFTPRLGSL